MPVYSIAESAAYVKHSRGIPRDVHANTVLVTVKILSVHILTVPINYLLLKSSNFEVTCHIAIARLSLVVRLHPRGSNRYYRFA